MSDKDKVIDKLNEASHAWSGGVLVAHAPDPEPFFDTRCQVMLDMCEDLYFD